MENVKIVEIQTPFLGKEEFLFFDEGNDIKENIVETHVSYDDSRLTDCELPTSYVFKGGCLRADNIECQLNGKFVPGIEVWASGIKDNRELAFAAYEAADINSILLVVENDQHGLIVEKKIWKKIAENEWEKISHEYE